MLTRLKAQILALFHQTKPGRATTPGRACRNLTLAARLDLSLSLGAFEPQVFAWNY